MRYKSDDEGTLFCIRLPMKMRGIFIRGMAIIVAGVNPGFVYRIIVHERVSHCGWNSNCAQSLDISKYHRPNLLNDIFERHDLPSFINSGSRERRTARWNQSMMFSVTTLDDILQFVVNCYDKYTQDEYLGETSVALSIMDYKKTEKMKLKLKDGSGHLAIEMHYKNYA